MIPGRRTRFGTHPLLQGPAALGQVIQCPLSSFIQVLSGDTLLIPKAKQDKKNPNQKQNRPKPTKNLRNLKTTESIPAVSLSLRKKSWISLTYPTLLQRIIQGRQFQALRNRVLRRFWRLRGIKG